MSAPASAPLAELLALTETVLAEVTASRAQPGRLLDLLRFAERLGVAARALALLPSADAPIRAALAERTEAFLRYVEDSAPAAVGRDPAQRRVAGAWELAGLFGPGDREAEARNLLLAATALATASA